jgi:hypothetical protein
MVTPPSGEQGDVNSTDERRRYIEGLDAETRHRLEEDANCFLHQALSTFVMNVLSKTEGPALCTPLGEYLMRGERPYDASGALYHQRRLRLGA